MSQASARAACSPSSPAAWTTRRPLVTWRQGRCLPFGSNVTFWALSEIVRSSAGILESDGVARAEARLETVLPKGPERAQTRARLRPLLGLESEEASRDDNFEVWRAFLEALAADGPAIVVVEDLHWADDAMLAFLDYLALSNAQVPLLVLATARPEVLELGGPGAGFVAAATRLPLGPLSGEETAELARAGLGAKSLPTDLQALILERSAATRCSPRSSCASSRIAACWRTAAARSASGPAPRSRCPTRSARSSPPVSTCSSRSARPCSPTPPLWAAPSGSGRWPQWEALSPPRSTRA